MTIHDTTVLLHVHCLYCVLVCSWMQSTCLKFLQVHTALIYVVLPYRGLTYSINMSRGLAPSMKCSNVHAQKERDANRHSLHMHMIYTRERERDRPFTLKVSCWSAPHGRSEESLQLDQHRGIDDIEVKRVKHGKNRDVPRFFWAVYGF